MSLNLHNTGSVLVAWRICINLSVVNCTKSVLMSRSLFGKRDRPSTRVISSGRYVMTISYSWRQSSIRWRRVGAAVRFFRDIIFRGLRSLSKRTGWFYMFGISAIRKPLLIVPVLCWHSADPFLWEIWMQTLWAQLQGLCWKRQPEPLMSVVDQSEGSTFLCWLYPLLQQRFLVATWPFVLWVFR